MPTITGRTKLPGGTTTLRGIWRARIHSNSNAAIDVDGTIRAGEEQETDIGDGATMVLPVGIYDFRFESLDNVSASGGKVHLGWYSYEVTGDTNWGEIMETPVVIPVTPADVTLAEQARDDAQQAAADAEAAKVAAQAVPATTDGQQAYNITTDGTATKAALSAAIGGQVARRAKSVLAGAVPITSKPDWFSTGLSSGTLLEANYRGSHNIMFDAQAVRVLFAHSSGIEGSGAGYTPTNTADVSCALEMPDGTKIPFFFGGRRIITMDPSGLYLSDPIPVKVLSGTKVWTRTHVKVPTGGKFPVGRARQATEGEGGDTTTNTTDQTLTGTISTSSVFLFGPVALIGVPADESAKKIVAELTDSIGWGQGDIVGSGLYPLGFGFLDRALATAALPHLKLGCQGELGESFANPIGRVTRGQLLAACTHAICEYGINDIRKPVTATTLQATLVAIWTYTASLGIKVWQTTITPDSSSNDAWATVTGQTARDATQNGHRVTVNDWIRAGAPLNAGTKAPVAVGTVGALLAGQVGHPLSGYYEVADTVESSRNSGLWKAPGRVVLDGVTTAASATITSATANFQPGDVGKRIFIAGAGAGGVDYVGTINARTSATQVAVANPVPSTTVSGARLAVDAQVNTSDGIHPGPEGHIKMQAGVDVGLLT